MRQKTERGLHRRGRGDEGAALVEFAFVGVLLFTLVFGIISFGLLLSFKQDMTRAAAEGARAGAVAVAVAPQTPAEAATVAAQTATYEAVEEFGGSFDDGVGCSHDGIDCTNIFVGDCTEDVTKDCVFVELTYDYEAEPLFGRIPLVSAFMPDEVRSKSEARINE